MSSEQSRILYAVVGVNQRSDISELLNHRFLNFLKNFWFEFQDKLKQVVDILLWIGTP